MTVEAYLRAQVPGYPFDSNVVANAALSPIFAKPTAFQALNLQDNIEDRATDADFLAALKYATSTLFYSASGVFSGGSRSEQIGDISASVSGFVITQSDRENYRAMADKLREEIGAEVEESVTEQGGMFDASEMRLCRKTY
jgi:hypothetical protein